MHTYRHPHIHECIQVRVRPPWTSSPARSTARAGPSALSFPPQNASLPDTNASLPATNAALPYTVPFPQNVEVELALVSAADMCMCVCRYVDVYAHMYAGGACM